MDNTIKTTVLVVDDDEIIRELATEMLSDFGYEVIVAAGGEEAIELIGRGERAISLVLLDVHMEGMTGTETLARIRDMHQDLPVVLMSGLMTDQTAEELLGQGATNVLKKPFHINHLREAIENSLPR